MVDGISPPTPKWTLEDNLKEIWRKSRGLVIAAGVTAGAIGVNYYTCKIERQLNITDYALVTMAYIAAISTTIEGVKDRLFWRKLYQDVHSNLNQQRNDEVSD